MQEKKQPKSLQEQAKAWREAIQEHRQKEATDPEYRKKTERMQKFLDSVSQHGDDTEE